MRSYFAYGKPVLAVADGRVVMARDGLPENVPGHGESFHPAVPITLETVAGNTITLDLGGGQFAYYMHLQPGSLRVKAGDRVRRGQVLARIGCTGDAREPHLHFEVTTSSKLVSGEGVPYLIDRYRCKSRVAGLRNSTHTSCLWIIASSHSGKTDLNDDEAHALTTAGHFAVEGIL